MKKQHLRVRLLDEGTDVFAPREGKTWGYRYGPSIMQYGDGRIDAWFASPGAGGVEADWFTYRHSDDGGVSWTDEKVVLCPTPDSMDFYSVCDPAVIFIDGWYYMGYTSTIFSHAGGVCNNAFVARSRKPDGPWEKWTGSGWGETRETADENGNPLTLRWQGDPAPIVYYDEPWENWGAGEPSFVRVGDTLYLYYTWTSKDKDGVGFSQTRVATADLTAGERWPATLTDRGVAIRRPNGTCDSSDVVYVDGADKFLILCTDRRFTENSCLAVYESDDGLRFTRSCEVRAHVGEKCHNCGIAGGPDRHISLGGETVVGYAYGSQWGYWGTRFHRAVVELTDEPDFSDAANPSSPYPVKPWPMPSDPWPIHLTTVPHAHVMKVSEGPVKIDLRWVDTAYDLRPCPEAEVTVDEYDPMIVRFDGLTCTPLRPGKTSAVAH
ncbi:MAG: exo-alpha-sialidase [Ruminococcaceae bacterium]|nr:exo-alpha-sialidase [Oscillospiraceae bacterium]